MSARLLMTAANQRRPSGRRAFVLAVVLVGLLVVLLMAAGVSQALVTDHRQVRRFERSQQSLWLAESAVQRARARLAADPEYSGESWSVPAEELGGVRPGRIMIQVDPPGDPPTGRLVRITASWPADAVDRCTTQREFSTP